jgi:hypothetical protein
VGWRLSSERGEQWFLTAAAGEAARRLREAWRSEPPLVGLARLRLGAHRPSDLAGGVVVGGVWLAGVTHSLSRVP